MENICEKCKHYFNYESIHISRDGSVGENNFSSCLKYGNNFQIQQYMGKNYTKKCSQFEAQAK